MEAQLAQGPTGTPGYSRRGLRATAPPRRSSGGPSLRAGSSACSTHDHVSLLILNRLNFPHLHRRKNKKLPYCNGAGRQIQFKRSRFTHPPTYLCTSPGRRPPPSPRTCPLPWGLSRSRPRRDRESEPGRPSAPSATDFFWGGVGGGQKGNISRWICDPAAPSTCRTVKSPVSR